jgi:hypothetical protein
MNSKGTVGPDERASPAGIVFFRKGCGEGGRPCPASALAQDNLYPRIAALSRRVPRSEKV